MPTRIRRTPERSSGLAMRWARPWSSQRPAAVNFAGKPLSWNPLLVWHETTLPGKVTSGTYSYTNTAGLRLENAVQIGRSIDLPASLPTTLARSQSFTLAWVGEPIAQDEDLEVVLANQQDPLKFVRFDQINKGSTDLVLSAAQLNQLPAGATSIALRRHQNGVPGAAPAAGGRTQATYEAKQRIITLQ